MNNALIGYTGFVGGNIHSQMTFQHLFNSSNYLDMKNMEYDLLVFSGAKAEKWKANLYPIDDRNHIDDIIDVLKTVKAKKAVLISTVDVYPNPIGVNENTKITDNNHAYGSNRLVLESFFHNQFEHSLIIRLPGLYGNGIKKNIIFDFLNNNQIEKIDSRGSFQFYNLEHIWADIQKSLTSGIRLLNVATEPVTVAEIAKYCFGNDFKNEILPSPVKYDFHSIHSLLWGNNNGYLYTKNNVLEECKKFVNEYKEKR